MIFTSDSGGGSNSATAFLLLPSSCCQRQKGLPAFISVSLFFFLIWKGCHPREVMRRWKLRELKEERLHLLCLGLRIGFALSWLVRLNVPSLYKVLFFELLLNAYASLFFSGSNLTQVKLFLCIFEHLFIQLVSLWVKKKFHSLLLSEIFWKKRIACLPRLPSPHHPPAPSVTGNKTKITIWPAHKVANSYGMHKRLKCVRIAVKI